MADCNCSPVEDASADTPLIVLINREIGRVASPLLLTFMGVLPPLLIVGLIYALVSWPFERFGRITATLAAEMLAVANPDERGPLLAVLRTSNGRPTGTDLRRLRKRLYRDGEARKEAVALQQILSACAADEGVHA